MIASLPMYPIYRDDVQALWSAVATDLHARGMPDVPMALSWPDDLPAHVRRPDLLLSQTCGYPLVKKLSDAVRVVGAFRYTTPGCEGVRYRSMVIARVDDSATTLLDFRGRRAAYNGPDSQSGYNCLRALVAPLAVEGRFFSATLATGAHYASMQAVADSRADIAAIDCVSFAQICAAEPALAKTLKSVGKTASVPGLPLITHGSTTDAEIAILRATLSDVIRKPEIAKICARLLIDGFEPIGFEAYAEIIAMETTAIRAGYPVLN